MCHYYYSFKKIIGRPSRPHTLTLKDAGATWLCVNWRIPLTFISPITFYTINAHNLNSSEGTPDEVYIVVTNTSTNATFFNVTGLLPGTTYELTVVAASQARGDIVATGEPIFSHPVIHTTKVEG